MDEAKFNEFYMFLMKREDRIMDAIANLKNELRAEFRTALAETKEELRAEFRTELNEALSKIKDEILEEVGNFITEDISTEVVHINELKKLEKRVTAVEKVVFPEGYIAVNEDSEEYDA